MGPGEGLGAEGKAAAGGDRVLAPRGRVLARRDPTPQGPGREPRGSGHFVVLFLNVPRQKVISQAALITLSALIAPQAKPTTSRFRTLQPNPQGREAPGMGSGQCGSPDAAPARARGWVQPQIIPQRPGTSTRAHRDPPSDALCHPPPQPRLTHRFHPSTPHLKKYKSNPKGKNIKP